MNNFGIILSFFLPAIAAGCVMNLMGRIYEYSFAIFIFCFFYSLQNYFSEFLLNLFILSFPWRYASLFARQIEFFLQHLNNQLCSISIEYFSLIKSCNSANVEMVFSFISSLILSI